MTKRLLRRQPKVKDALPSHLPPLLRRIYLGRGLGDARELDLGLGGLWPPSDLKGAEAAAELLHLIMARGGRILILGDFDADGATSCALGVRVLRALGAPDVRYLVPDRFRYGYGLTPEIVRVAAEWRPDLLVTVDNGISSHAGVAAARALGMAVLVTDHHLPGGDLPQADVIVNPNQPGDGYPSKHLAGVGVIFNVLAVLRARLRVFGWFAARGLSEPNLADFLDLVALGTVADLVPLDHNNRILVEQGLRRLRQGRACPGIRALLECAGRSQDQLVAADLAFAVGPRLNAAGRLADMALGIECLLADDEGRARELAGRLDGLNRERRQIEVEMKEQALEDLAELEDSLGTELPCGLCLFRPEWHQGVIGILAARVKERWHRPVIAFAEAGEGKLKGSARSVPGLHMRDTLEAVASRHPDLIERFGGHAMAAGLSLSAEAFEPFCVAFDQEVRRRLDPGLMRGEIWSDGELQATDLNLETATCLRFAGPWGQGFPEPLFDGKFPVLGSRLVGERHLRLDLGLPGQEGRVQAIAFNAEDMDLGGDCLHLAYRLDVNRYQGESRLQLIVEDWLEEE